MALCAGRPAAQSLQQLAALGIAEVELVQALLQRRCIERSRQPGTRDDEGLLLGGEPGEQGLMLGLGPHILPVQPQGDAATGEQHQAAGLQQRQRREHAARCQQDGREQIDLLGHQSFRVSVRRAAPSRGRQAARAWACDPPSGAGTPGAKSARASSAMVRRPSSR
jgi:hypothetical protein